MNIKAPLPARLTSPTTSLALCLTGLSLLPLGAQANTLTEALTQGQPKADIRLRYETVTQDNTKKDATAATVRTRLGYHTGNYNGFEAFVEMESVSALAGEDYFSKTNGNNSYSVIADPVGAEMNQASLSYKGLSDTTLTWGRQRVILDNARFVGNVGWRQNEQTYDGFVVTNQSLPDTTATYAYVYNVNGITGGDTDVKAHLLNVAYDGLSAGKLTGYGYFIDFVNEPADSQQTLGLRFTGKQALGEGMALLYSAEYAQQSDYQDGAATVDADYLLGELGVKISNITAKLSYEVLGGDGSYGFSTPLATKHAFNGWSDQFLATPDVGLVDTYLTLATQVAGAKLAVIYHDYSADEGNTDYGTEWNAVAVRKFGKTYSALLKYASYAAGDTTTEGLVDTDKLWLQGQIKF